jgi:hypothetical protein
MTYHKHRNHTKGIEVLDKLGNFVFPFEKVNDDKVDINTDFLGGCPYKMSPNRMGVLATWSR